MFIYLNVHNIFKPAFLKPMKKSVTSKELARERIETLFTHARERLAYAKRYIALARKIATRAKTPIPKHLKRQFCKTCNSLLVFGKNATLRQRGALIIRCLDCGTIKRIPLRKQ